MRKDYIVTYVAEFAVLIVTLLVYRLAATLPGSGFFEYALSIRFVGFLTPLLLLGFGVGIPRYVAYEGEGDNDAADNYLLGGLACSGLFFLLLCFFAYFLRNFFSRTVFGSVEYVHLILPCLVFVAGQLLTGLLYSYFRGRLQMGLANILQLLASGLAPLLAFTWFANSSASVLNARGILATCVGISFLLFICFRPRMNIGLLYRDTLKILKYGIGRIPGDFSLAAMFILPASYVAHTSGIEKAGAVAFSISLLNMVGYMFSPIGVILLPQASKLVAQGELAGLRQNVQRLIFIAMTMVIFGVIAFELMAVDILRFYLGANLGYVPDVARICMLGALPLVLFYLLRSIVDAQHVRPVNSRNIIISLIVMGVLMLIGYFTKRDSETWSAVYLVLALFVLGGLTAVETVKILVFPTPRCPPSDVLK